VRRKQINTMLCGKRAKYPPERELNNRILRGNTSSATQTPSSLKYIRKNRDKLIPTENFPARETHGSPAESHPRARPKDNNVDEASKGKPQDKT
jgi:hypothetical protein